MSKVVQPENDGPMPTHPNTPPPELGALLRAALRKRPISQQSPSNTCFQILDVLVGYRWIFNLTHPHTCKFEVCFLSLAALLDDNDPILRQLQATFQRHWCQKGTNYSNIIPHAAALSRKDAKASWKKDTKSGMCPNLFSEGSDHSEALLGPKTIVRNI